MIIIKNKSEESVISIIRNNIEEYTPPKKVKIQKDKTITITENGKDTFYPDNGYDGIGKVIVNVDVESGVTVEGDISITSNGSYDVSTYATATVNVPDTNGSYNEGYGAGITEGYNAGYELGKEDGATEQKMKMEPITITENGTYTREDGYNEVTVNVPDTNGSYDEGYGAGITEGYNAGYNLGKEDGTTAGRYQILDEQSDADITTGDVLLGKIGYGKNNTKVVGTVNLTDIRENAYDNGYNKGYNDRTDDYNEILSDATITPSTVLKGYIGYGANATQIIGEYEPTSGGGGTNYSYKVPTADADGLRAIGWDDESIGLYKDNNLQYAWNVGNFTVSDENKALYGVITDDTSISNNKTNPDFKYCPMFDTSNVTDMSFMFDNCSKLISIPQLDTSNVTTMRQMFNGCYSLTTIPPLNTSNVTNMYNMFYGCTSLTTIPQLDTSKVTDMNSMFRDCVSLQSIPLLDTSNDTTMYYMFYGCTSLQSIPQLDTSKVDSMYYSFCGCTSLKTIPQLNTSNVYTMYYMFRGCTSLQSIPQLDTSNVTNMGYIFQNCSKLISIPQLDTSKVTNMTSMFNNCTLLTSIPELDCSSVTTTTSPIGSTILSKLTDLGGFLNLKISWSSNFLDRVPNATHQSLLNVINGLYDLTANGLSGKTVKFGTTNLAKLTEDEIAIATNKGWTIT